MNDMMVFEKVASREMSPEQAAAEMMEADRRARARRKPAAVPVWLWTAGGALAALVLAFFGFNRD